MYQLGFDFHAVPSSGLDINSQHLSTVFFGWTYPSYRFTRGLPSIS